MPDDTSYVDDMSYDQPDDPWDDDDVYDTDEEQIRYWNRGYNDMRGIQVRIEEGMVSLPQLAESNFTIDSETGNVREKTDIEKFLRDYKYILILLGIGVFIK